MHLNSLNLDRKSMWHTDWADLHAAERIELLREPPSDFTRSQLGKQVYKDSMRASFVIDNIG